MQLQFIELINSTNTVSEFMNDSKLPLKYAFQLTTWTEAAQHELDRYNEFMKTVEGGVTNEKQQELKELVESLVTLPDVSIPMDVFEKSIDTIKPAALGMLMKWFVNNEQIT